MIFTILALLGAAIASYTDLKNGIIQNKLTFSLFTAGVLGNLLVSGKAVAGALFSSIIMIFILGYGFWFIGGWSAGDAKEFLFLAALLPRYPAELQGLFTPKLGPYPFIITILANTFLAIFPFILIWGIYTSLRLAKTAELLGPLKEIRNFGLNAGLLTAALLIAVLLNIGTIFVLTLILLGYKLGDRMKTAVSSLVIFGFILFTGEVSTALTNFIGMFAVIILFQLLWNAVSIVRRFALEETVPASELREGMVPAEEIYIGEDKIETGARGLNMEELEKIKNEKNPLKLAAVRVKKTIPFAPIIFIGLVLSLALGDLIVVAQNLVVQNG
ncbi:MAG: prepilin peptidase [Candidatus Hydrothermarchaeales archaeon]